MEIFFVGAALLTLLSLGGVIVLYSIARKRKLRREQERRQWVRKAAKKRLEEVFHPSEESGIKRQEIGQ